MALHRGIQSAVFYYLSCAPCTGYNYRKKRRKEAIRDREDKLALEEEQPGLYRHPSPFATNPNWQIEIDLGPHHGPLARRKKGGKNGADNTWALTSTGTRTSGEGDSKVTMSTDLAASAGASGPESRNDSKLNVRRYQREDEELWGSQQTMRRTRTTKYDGPAAGISRPQTAKTSKSDKSATSYHAVRNPPINEMHPPIITKMDSREDVVWMLQPPPPVRVMQGKESVGRGRSDSAESKHAVLQENAEDKLSRQYSERLLGEKLQKSQTMGSSDLSRGGSGRRRARTTAARPQRAVRRDSSSSSDDLANQRRRRQAALNASEDSDISTSTVIRRPLAGLPSSTSNLPMSSTAKPPLSPIHSDSRTPSPHTRLPMKPHHPITTTNRDRTSTPRRSVVTTKDSLAILQDLVPTKTSLLNLQTNTTTDPKTPSFEARVSLPPTDSIEENELRKDLSANRREWLRDSLGDALDFGNEDGWRSRDRESSYGEGFEEAVEEFRFPQWAAERVKRTVTHRWSMDF